MPRFTGNEVRREEDADLAAGDARELLVELAQVRWRPPWE
jgi:hypothetical protein